MLHRLAFPKDVPGAIAAIGAKSNGHETGVQTGAEVSVSIDRRNASMIFDEALNCKLLGWYWAGFSSNF